MSDLHAWQAFCLLVMVAIVAANTLYETRSKK